VYQAGTLSGNPLAMAAGLATLEVLAEPGVWDKAERWAAHASETLAAAADAARIPFTVQRVGTMFTGFFTDGPVGNYADAKRSDRAQYGRYFHAMLEHGVYLPPSQFEAAFSSAVHGKRELDVLGRAAAAAFAGIS
jgi:glutamate-1-semialdehyde 2,1-aminomutase